MKKILLALLTITHSSMMFAMNPIASLSNSGNSNTQDADGNTPLHHAVIAFQESSKAASLKEEEYNALNEKFRKITREMKKAKDQPKDQTEDLESKRKSLQEKAKRVKTAHQSSKQRATAAKKEAQSLIERGSYINTPNKKRKTPEQLCPSLFEELIYTPLSKATYTEDTTSIQKIMQAGANPDFTNEYHVTALQSSVVGNKPKTTKALLLHGAKLSAPEVLTNGNILHIAAKYKLSPMIQTLLESPQGSPARRLKIPERLKKCQQRMLTFLGCLKQQEETLPELPLEIEQEIYSYVLPSAQELINLVPLQELPKYKKYLGKPALVKALTKRHMYLIQKALMQPDSHELPPHLRARADILAGFPFADLIAIDAEENETSKLLNPKDTLHEGRKEIIKKNYEKVLE